MSDTPETDAKAHSIFGNHSCATVLADFARKLERERDEAREKLADALQEVDLRTLDFDRMRAERDEARKKLEEEMKWHHQTHKELVETQCKLLDIEYDKLKS